MINYGLSIMLNGYITNIEKYYEFETRTSLSKRQLMNHITFLVYYYYNHYHCYSFYICCIFHHICLILLLYHIVNGYILLYQSIVVVAVCVVSLLFFVFCLRIFWRLLFFVCFSDTLGNDCHLYIFIYSII